MISFFVVVVVSFLNFEVGVTQNSRKTKLQMYSIFTLKDHIKNKIKFDVSFVLCLNNQDSCTSLYTTIRLGQNQLTSRIKIENISKLN